MVSRVPPSNEPSAGDTLNSAGAISFRLPEKLLAEPQPFQVGVWCLCQQDSALARAVFQTPEVSIGRSKENHLILSLRSISKRHAVVRYREGLLLLEDQGSINRTLVNYRKVEHETVIRVGDRVHLGEFLLWFDVGPGVPLAPGSSPAEASPESPAVKLGTRDQLALYDRYTETITQWTKSIGGVTLNDRLRTFFSFALESFHHGLLGEVFQPPTPRDRVELSRLPADYSTGSRSQIQRALAYLIETSSDAPPVEFQHALVQQNYSVYLMLLQQRARTS